MAEIYGSHFEYAGRSSRLYGLIFATIDTTRNTSVSGEISGVTIFNKKTQQNNLIDTDYRNSPLSFDVEITSEDGRNLNHFERIEIERWLFNRHDYRRMYLDINDDCYGETASIIRGLQVRLYLNCRFINARKIENDGGIVGYAATLESDAGFWWQDEVSYNFQPENASESSISIIDVPVSTDIDDYIYPTITFTTGSVGGSVTFVNNTDSTTRLSTFTNLPANATVTVKGAINYVSDAYYEKFTTANFPRLLDGENKFTIRGNVAAISFTFQNRRML